MAAMSSSRSRRHFHWSSTTSRVTTSEEEDHHHNHHQTSIDGAADQIQNTKEEDQSKKPISGEQQQRRKLPAIAVSRIKSVLVTAFSTGQLSRTSPRSHTPRGLGPKVIGTLFGHRKGHVSFVFQREHNSSPVFFIELATPITSLVKEMASGLVRIALECDKQDQEDNNKNRVSLSSSSSSSRSRSRKTGASSTSKRLLEEPIWRTYCNGKRCGFATKRDPGPRELKILKAVEPISMGAGVLPGFNGSGLSGPDGELMYMRAKFERVVGSRDSEAFYMMNPDCNGAPELSIYLLRV